MEDIFGKRDPEDPRRQFLFDTIEIRNRFVQKVYTILSVQMWICFGFVVVAINSDSVKMFLAENAALVLMAGLAAFFSAMSLSCCPWMGRKHPWNFIFLGLVTIGYTLMLGAISCAYDTHVVYLAIGTTALIFLLVSVFACQTKWDVTEWGFVLFIVTVALLIYIVASAIFMRYVPTETARQMDFVVAAFILVLFIFILMFDTQLIMGSRTFEISPEDYVIAALKLYLLASEFRGAGTLRLLVYSFSERFQTTNTVVHIIIVCLKGIP